MKAITVCLAICASEFAASCVPAQKTATGHYACTPCYDWGIRVMNALCKVLAAALFYLTAFTVTCSAWAAPPTKGTEILWDRYGIPHIFAPDRPSLFYAYGYAQMEAHAELLVRLYTQSRGRAAEFYGDQYLDSDRWVRVNSIP